MSLKEAEKLAAGRLKKEGTGLLFTSDSAITQSRNGPETVVRLYTDDGNIKYDSLKLVGNRRDLQAAQIVSVAQAMVNQEGVPFAVVYERLIPDKQTCLFLTPQFHKSPEMGFRCITTDLSGTKILTDRIIPASPEDKSAPQPIQLPKKTDYLT